MRPLYLAPMEDVTDPAFRRLCKRFGADRVYTEFINADALIRDIPQMCRKLTICDEERPVAIQLYGRDVDSMVRAAKIVAQVKPDYIDLNFGCPVKKIATKGAGAGLLQNIPLLLDITRAVVRAVEGEGIPVTAKTRLGWDNEHKIIVELAEALQDCGIKELAIHGRTRSDLYRGEADWTLIGEVKNNPRMHIPIIGNGDIDTPQKAKEYFERYGVDAIMIGRATFGAPWIFEDIKYYLTNGELYPKWSMKECMDILKEHIDHTIDWIGNEQKAIIHCRRHFAASPIFKGLTDFRTTRIELLRAQTRTGVYEVMERILQRWG